MHDEGWIILTLEVDADQAEAMADALREEYDLEPVELARPGATHVWLELYFQDPKKARETAEQIQKTYPMRTCSFRALAARDWQTFWRHHFHPHRVGERLLICPEWEPDAEPESDRVRLVIDPGLSFGTGEHFTTRFCMEMVERYAPPGPCRSLWDVGCGSGILALAGARLGMDRIHGTDNDPKCLIHSQHNARLNGVADRITWGEEDITKSRPGGEAFDLVCANLFALILLEAAPVLWSATRRYIALSGIREFEVDMIAEAFIQQGGEEVLRDGDGEWAGIVIRRGA